jgi:hypothetical protein
VVERISVVTCNAPEDIHPQLPRANLPAVGCPNQGDFDVCLRPIRVFAEHSLASASREFVLSRISNKLTMLPRGGGSLVFRRAACDGRTAWSFAGFGKGMINRFARLDGCVLRDSELCVRSAHDVPISTGASSSFMPPYAGKEPLPRTSCGGLFRRILLVGELVELHVVQRAADLLYLAYIYCLHDVPCLWVDHDRPARAGELHALNRSE